MFHAAMHCLHRFAKVELSGRGRRARHTAALTTLKNKEKMKDPGKTVVEGKDCPELLVVTESTPFLLYPAGRIHPKLNEGTSRKDISSLIT